MKISEKIKYVGFLNIVNGLTIPNILNKVESIKEVDFKDNENFTSINIDIEVSDINILKSNNDERWLFLLDNDNKMHYIPAIKVHTRYSLDTNIVSCAIIVDKNYTLIENNKYIFLKSSPIKISFKEIISRASYVNLKNLCCYDSNNNEIKTNEQVEFNIKNELDEIIGKIF